MWFYTNAKGEVARLDNVNYQTIMDKFTENTLEKELVAVLKKASFGYGGVSGNDVKVISACEVKTVLSSVLSMRNQTSVIQRFVKTSSIKASIIRTCWRSNNAHEGWILNSNYSYTSSAKVNEISKFVVNTKHPSTFTATKCGSDKHLQQTLKYVKNIVKFVQGHLSIKFLEMVCDFVKDQGGNWWYINTKAFILQKPDQKIYLAKIYNHDCQQFEQGQRKKLQSYTKCKKCKYCYKVVAEHLMTHKLTLMMILQCDQNLIKMGKKYSWLQRCYSHHVGSVNLYVEHKVCDSCYKFYKEVQRLIKLQQELAKLTGIKFSTDNKNVVSITAVPYFKGQPPQFGSRLQKVQYETQMPEGWNLPENEQIKVELNANKSIYKRCRFMIFIHGIRDIPRQVLHKPHKYYLSFNFLEQNVKFKLNFDQSSILQNNENNELFNVQLNKMKLCYFFVQNRQEIIDFIKSQENLRMTLYEDEEVLGKIEMELNDFRSDKVIKRDYFKMFSGKNIFPYLSWGLFATLGLHEGMEIETSSLRLSKKNGLLFPQAQYHSPDPIPQDWLQMIDQKNDIYQSSSKIKLDRTHNNGLTSFKQSQMENNSRVKKFLDEQISNYTRKSQKNMENNNNKNNNFTGSSTAYNEKVKRKPHY